MMDCGYDCVFSIFIFIIGCVLLATNFKIDHALSNCPNSNSARNTNKFVLILSLISILVSLSYMICQSKLHSIRGALVGNYGPTFYLGFILMIGITLIISGSTLVNSAKNDNCPEAANSANTVLGLGITMTVVTSIYFAYVIFPHARAATQSLYKGVHRNSTDEGGTELRFPMQSNMCGSTHSNMCGSKRSSM
jgi:hypothetical protein